jgi:pimeloyl-ACP methyl ester carboxylesterase
MKRIRPYAAGLAAIVALLALPIASASAGKHHTSAAQPTIVLVHGAWADGSSWDGVVKVLQREGYTVDAPPNPLRGLASDSDYLKDYLGTISGPIVLVGHSYGGAVITDAATGDSHVKALVYVDAFIPDKGESVMDLLTPKNPEEPGLNPEELFNFVPFPGAPKGVADLYLKPEVVPVALANDMSSKEAAVIAATQRPIAANALAEKSTAPAWKKIPSWDVIGTEDHIIPPPLQEFMAQRAGSKVTEVKGSHLTLITHPKAVAGVIATAAKHVH